MANIFQQQIVPQKPKVLAEERIYVYMPAATGDNKGLASFNPRDFNAPNGYASLKWPVEMLVETLADPLVRPSFTKVMNDEFVHTNSIVKVTNPNTGVSYSSSTAEIKLNRENRNAFSRPDLVMLNLNDFEEEKVLGPNNEQYNSYKLKKNNPFTTPTIIQVNSNDFVSNDSIVEVSWPYAHNTALGTIKTNGYGLVRISPSKTGSLSFDRDNNLQVDIDMLKQNMANHLATKVTYGETDTTKWTDRDAYVDANGIAKRDANGNTLISITKQAVGLSKVENIAFKERTYDQFGTEMKQYFSNQFNSKLDRSNWDGPTGIFRDWAPPSTDRNTVQKWFEILELEDNSIWSSIRTLNMFLGYYDTFNNLVKTHKPNATIFASAAYVMETMSYYSVKPINNTRYQFIYRDHTGLESITGQSSNDRAVNLNTGIEYVWNGTNWIEDGVHPEYWEWYNTGIQDLSFLDLVETDKNQLQPNAPIANVSVGRSGKWIQSDHIHPSDPNKMDADLIENATIDITTLESNNNDFRVVLAAKSIFDSNLQEIDATVVSTPEYLNSILNPSLNDLAVTRTNGNIYEYNGKTWVNTGELATIKYNANSIVNIPYVRTGQFIHNWKAAPTLFTQSANSNEGYWAGTQEEFDNLDLDDMPNNFIFNVDDGESLEPGDLVVTQSMDSAGITLPYYDELSFDRLIITNKNTNLENRILTIKSEPATASRAERRYLVPYDFGPVVSTPSNDSRMVISYLDNNGNTVLGHRLFGSNKLIVSDTYGNLQSHSIVPDTIVTTDVALEEGLIIIGGQDKTIKTFNSGLVANIPLVSNGAGGLRTLTLTANRLVQTDDSGALQTADINLRNLLKTSVTNNELILPEGQLLVSGGANTVIPWNAGTGTAGSLIVMGDTTGQISTKSWNNSNRLLYTAANGTLGEIGAGNAGDYLVSTGGGIPVWQQGPQQQSVLPQKQLTSNPTEAEANAFTGLVAVILDNAPEVTELRNNCIYYY